MIQRLLSLLGLALLAACSGESATSSPVHAADAGAGGTAADDGAAGSSAASSAGAAGAGGESPFPSDSEISTAAYDIAEGVCARLFACCDSTYAQTFYEDEADCYSTYGRTLLGAIHGKETAVLAGRVGLHLDVAERCVGGAITCDASPWACGRGLFEPLVPLGGSCEFWHECIDGSCEHETSTCQTRQPDHAACYFDEDCLSNRCYFYECEATPETPPAEACVD